MQANEILQKLDGHGDLTEQQALLESLSQGLGIEQYWRQIQKAREGGRESNTSYGTHLVSHAVTKVAQGIREFIDKAETGAAGRRHLAVRYLKMVEPDVAAFLALKAAIDGITMRRPVQKVAVGIGSLLEDQVKFTRFQDENAKAFKYAQDQVKAATTYRHKKNVMNTKMTKAGVDHSSWSEVDRLHLGIKLLDLIVQTTGYIEISDAPQSIFKASRKPSTVKIITATAEMLKWIEDKNSRCEILAPKYLPCVIPPKDWESPIKGGYHTAQVRPLTLIKTSHKNFLEEVTNRKDEMPKVYRAVNALQRTPWKVNSKVLDTMRRVWDEGIETSSLVSRRDTTEIACSVCGSPVPLSQRNSRSSNHKHECFEKDEEALRRWKVSAAKAHEANARLISKRIQVQKVIWIAEIMSKYDRIYMPYQLDFRGRIYAVPFYLNPQGADYAKGLLTFSEGKPLGDELAAGWLAIHGANTYGHDKVSLADRISFIGTQSKQILATADDPLGMISYWSEADKPWQFLAFCFEWAGYIREGLSYVSHLPIALDGSCSGIQHFSAMLRDELGAEAVNLLPSRSPNDIYQMVCNRVIEKLKEHQQDPETYPYAAGWLALNPDRKLTKRQVMTLPYGSTLFSCKEYTNEYLSDLKDSRSFIDPNFRLPWPDAERYRAVSYMADLIWGSIGEVVIGAREVMDWLKAWAKKTAQLGLPIVWTTPAGFPVFQAYSNMHQNRVKTQLGEGVRLDLTLRQRSAGLDKKRMENGIAPNFVHSMDACHLVMSVDYALSSGIQNFAMIHDSFGTHAAETERFSELIRESFVDLYQHHDVLGGFKQSMRDILPEEALKKTPEDLSCGSLNLELVKGSSFFFA